MDMDKLENLEAKIEEMLARHSAVCEERDRLSRELGAVQERLQETTEQLQRHEKERTEIKNKVERILGRLDGLHLA